MDKEPLEPMQVNATKFSDPSLYQLLESGAKCSEQSFFSDPCEGSSEPSSGFVSGARMPLKLAASAKVCHCRAAQGTLYGVYDLPRFHWRLVATLSVGNTASVAKGSMGKWRNCTMLHSSSSTWKLRCS